METGHDVKRAPLIAAVMKRLEMYYEIFLETEDLSGLMDMYNRMLVNRDRDVLILGAKEQYQAHALGINRTGELIVRREDGTEEERVQRVALSELQAQNSDTVGWIEIPGTKVDYPILQSSTDDSYYLNHNIDGSEGYPGSIYTESYNGKTFEDFNTVIYGHNMKDDTMFGDLHSYEDSAFMKE